MPVLHGDAVDRLIEMRNKKNLTQAALCKELEKRKLGYFSKSMISRIESRKTQEVSSDLISALCAFYNVSADFLLGLTDIPDKKNYELSELGLSYDAARMLLTREINPDALNRLVLCKDFPGLCEMISAYFPSWMKDVYDEFGEMLPSLKSVMCDAEDLGYSISDIQKRQLKSQLSVLQEPAAYQKDAVKKCFELVVEELADSVMEQRQDPRPLCMETQELQLRLRQELMKMTHSANIRTATTDQKAEALARITARQLHFRREEENLLIRLLQMMMKNRENDLYERLRRVQ